MTLNRFVQCKQPIQYILCIYALTFLVIFPLLFNGRVFTVYFKSNDEKTKSNVLAENENRVKQATNHFKTINSNETLTYYSNINNRTLDVVIVLVTVKREENCHFPLQVAYRVDTQIRQNTAIKTGFVVCNVEKNSKKNKDAVFLSSYFPTVNRANSEYVNTYEKEKEDYIFCIEKSLQFNSEFVLMLEDDSLPRKNMLPYLKYIIENKIKNFVSRGDRIANYESYLAIKLFYPLRWSGYEFTVGKMRDLVGVCLFGAGLYPLLATIWCWYKRISHSLYYFYFLAICGGLYTLLCALLLERPNFLELFWLHPTLFRSTPAPGCCTPAVLYPKSQIRGLINFLNMTKCTSTRGLDLVIDEYAKTNKLKMRLVEPNLFHHIGFYSSLNGGKTMKTPEEEFLFD